MDINNFSVTAVTTQCSTIAQQAISSAAELHGLTSQPEFPALAALHGSLASLPHVVSQLQGGLQHATVVSPYLQGALAESINSGETLIGRLHKQVMRLSAENTARVNRPFVDGYVDFVTSFDALLDNAQHLIEKAVAASHRASQTDSILSDDASPILNLPLRQKGQTEEPPPYIPDSSPSEPPAPPEAGPSWSPFGSTISKSFKAFASSLKPKPDPLVSALCQAVGHGDLSQISGILSQGANVNGRGEDSRTPLQCAVAANQERAAQLLLDAGADSSSGSGLPPLFQAASVGSLGIARMFLARGADVNAASISGQKYYVDVIEKGTSLDGILLLLDNGASPNGANISGRSVLAHAVSKGKLELAELLIKFGAKVNGKDITGASILSVATGKTKTDDTRMVELLLSNGAKPDSTTIHGPTVLVEALTRRQLKLARLLLDHGAKGKKDDVTGQPVIIVVIKDAQISSEDKVDIVARLLENGASPNAKDMVWGRPVIIHAFESSCPYSVIEALVEHGAKTDAKMSNGHSLLLYAVENRKADLVRVLLEHGADPNKANDQSTTPLLRAVVLQDVEMVRVLVDFGADVLDSGRPGRVVEVARASGRSDIMNALKLSGGYPAEKV